MAEDELLKRIRELEEENGRLLARVERLELERSQPDSGRTILGLSSMVFQLDSNHHLAYVNHAVEEHLGVTRQTLIGKPLAAADQTRLGKGYLQFVYDQALRTKSEVSVDHSYVDPKTGRPRYVKVTVKIAEEARQILIEDQSAFKQLESNFKRYVSPKILEQLLQKDYDFYKPEKYELTVLFADLRGFTRLCTHLSPEQVKMLIDRFLSVMMRIIIDNDATVDKVIGDAVMALFGAPIRYTDHAIRAVNTALTMQETHEKLMLEWRDQGLPDPPLLGIGINTGEMIVGNIGSELQMSYTVLGHHVNLASRLCSSAKGGEILISPRTFELARESLQADPDAIRMPVKFRSSPEIQAKGIATPIKPINVVMARR